LVVIMANVFARGFGRPRVFFLSSWASLLRRRSV